MRHLCGTDRSDRRRQHHYCPVHVVRGQPNLRGPDARAAAELPGAQHGPAPPSPLDPGTTSPRLELTRARCYAYQVNWGSTPAVDVGGCPSRVLFECNKTATHGNGAKTGCTACDQCCQSYISDGKECDECAQQHCPKAANCQVVLPKECGEAKHADRTHGDSKGCERARASLRVALSRLLSSSLAGSPAAD